MKKVFVGLLMLVVMLVGCGGESDQGKGGYTEEELYVLATETLKDGLHKDLYGWDIEKIEFTPLSLTTIEEVQDNFYEVSGAVYVYATYEGESTAKYTVRMSFLEDGSMEWEYETY